MIKVVLDAVTVFLRSFLDYIFPHLQDQLTFLFVLQDTRRFRIESSNLNQLVVMKIVRREYRGRKVVFSVDLEALDW